MKSRTSTQPAEELLENLRALITEAEQAVNNGVSSASSQVISDLRDRLQSGVEKLNDYYDTAKDKVTSTARKTDDTIRSHPYESLAIALGVGVMIGALVRRN